MRKCDIKEYHVQGYILHSHYKGRQKVSLVGDKTIFLKSKGIINTEIKLVVNTGIVSSLVFS